MPTTTAGPNYVVTATAIAGTWGTIANSQGSTTGNYATWSHSARRDSATWQGAGFFATGDIPSGAVLKSITYTVRHKESNTSNITSVRAQLLRSGTVVDGPNTITESTTDATATFTVDPVAAGITVSDVPNLQIQVLATGANNTTAATLSIDYATLSVTYAIATPPTDAYSTAVEADNPVVYYRLDDTGATVSDWSANGYDAAVSGGVTTGVAGIVSGDAAMSFDGISGTVQGPSLPTYSPYSVEVWFKVPTLQTGTLVILGIGPNLYFYGSDSTYLPGSLEWNNGTDALNAGAGFVDGNWHHVVVTYDGTSIATIYVDGEQNNASSASTWGTIGGTFLEIASLNGTDFLAGTIDEVAIYSTALSAARVTAHYTAGGGALPTSVSTSDSGSGTESASITIQTFVSGSDTASGIESTSLSVIATTAEAATGIDAITALQQTKSSTDSASAIDSASVIQQTSLSVTDNGSVIDAASIFVTATITESGTATDSASKIDAGDTNPQASESASVVDAASIAVSVSDSATAVDSQTAIDTASPYIGQGLVGSFYVGGQGTGNPAADENAHGVDRVSLLAISSAESAVAADALPLTAMSQPDSAALSAETAQVGLQGTDVGQGTDSGSAVDIGNQVPVSAVEVGTAVDAVSLITVSVHETASAIEMNLISGDDFGFTKDAVLRVGVVAGDTASVDDVGQSGPATDSFGGADTAAGSEAATMFVTVSAADVGHAEDVDLSQKAAADSAQWVDEIFDLLAMESDAASSIEDESLLRMSTVTEGVVTIGSGGPVQLVEKQEEFIGRKTVTAKGGPRNVVGSRGKSSVRR